AHAPWRLHGRVTMRTPPCRSLPPPPARQRDACSPTPHARRRRGRVLATIWSAGSAGSRHWPPACCTCRCCCWRGGCRPWFPTGKAAVPPAHCRWWTWNTWAKSPRRRPRSRRHRPRPPPRACARRRWCARKSGPNANPPRHPKLCAWWNCRRGKRVRNRRHRSRHRIPPARRSAYLRGMPPGLLPEDQAFAFEAIAADGNTVLMRFTPAPGYYLYRDRNSFRIEGADGIAAGTPRWPKGVAHHDEHFGDVTVYFDQVEVELPLRRTVPGAVEAVLVATFQG